MTTLVEEIIEKSINEVFEGKVRKDEFYGSDGHVSILKDSRMAGLFFHLAAILFLITAAIFSLAAIMPGELEPYSVVLSFLSVVIIIISVNAGLYNAVSIRALPAEFLPLNEAGERSELLVLNEKHDAVSAYVERVKANRQLYVFDLKVAYRIEQNLKNRVGRVPTASIPRRI